MNRLQNKVALVLGAASRDNMGQDIARRFAAEGAKVVVAGRDLGELNRLADQIGGSAVRCDITRRADLDAAVAHAREWGGRLDVAVNAAGWGLSKGFLDTDEAELDRMLALQFKGPFMFLQAVLQGMEEGGSIIQISSATTQALIENYAAYIGTKAGIDHVVRCVANEFGARGIRANSISPGLTETPMTADAVALPGMEEGGSIIQISSATTQALIENYAAYIGTKAGIDHVVRCVANEYGARGIRANSISPGLTETPMTAGAVALPGLAECFARHYPLGRLGSKADVAAAAVWLASDECFMTGENLQVNGGLLLRGNPSGAELAGAIQAAAAAANA